MNGASCANDPSETDEEDDTEDVLDAGEVAADKGAHARWGGRFDCVGVGC